MAGIVVYRAGYFGLYDFSKVFVMPLLNIGQGADAHSLGAMATKFSLALTIDIFSALVAYPLDTVSASCLREGNRAIGEEHMEREFAFVRLNSFLVVPG